MKASSFRRRQSCFESSDFQVAPRNARVARRDAVDFKVAPCLVGRRGDEGAGGAASGGPRQAATSASFDAGMNENCERRRVGTSDFIDFDV